MTTLHDQAQGQVLKDVNGPRGDLKVTGNNSTNGGVFDKVRITGETEIYGDTHCRSFSCTGNSNVDGTLTAEELKLTGNLQVKEMLRAVKVNITGELEVGGAVSAEQLKLTGSCHAKKGIQSERLSIQGEIQSEGMVNAEVVELSLRGISRVGDIGGSQIRIGPSRANVLIPSWLRIEGVASLEADTIEGDTVILKNTTANTVRGREVVIGSGCRISRVEYSHFFEQDPQAEIKEVIRIAEDKQ